MRTAILILFSICVQYVPLAEAQESVSGTGTVLPAEEAPEEASGSGGVLEPPASGSGFAVPADVGGGTGTILPEPAIAPIPSPLSVRISEVLWAGSDLSTADEWLELTAVPLLTGATVTEPLSLDGWTVAQVSNGAETVIARLSPSHVIASGGYLVLSNYPADASRLRRPPSLVTSAMSLPNTKLQLRLRDAAGHLVDEVDDGVGAPFAGANPSGGIKASMERIDVRAMGTAKDNWRTAITTRGLDAGASVLGTPGYPNGTVEPPDTEAPLPVSHLRAFVVSGALIALWAPGSSADLMRQSVEVRAADEAVIVFLELPAASTGVVLEGEWPPEIRLEHHAIDDWGNASSGSAISVQPLLKPIINEILPDPEGSDDSEWIELHNPFERPLDLSGWMLRSGSRRYVLPHGSGSNIPPGGAILLAANHTGLSLPNAGGTIELSVFGRIIERLQYPALPEGVSYARSATGDAPVCSPTPGGAHAVRSMSIGMTGFVSEGTDPLTLNLAAVASGGTLAGARCQWDFGDGYTYDGCNPPAHRMKVVGDALIRLEVQDYCGTTVIHTQSVRVLQKAKKEKQIEEVRMCDAQVSTGIVLTEIFPAPSTAEEEWIELRHTGGPSVDLCGWSIDDREGGSDPYPLDGRRIGSGEYLLLPRKETGIALNNDQDIVRLIGPLPEGGTGVLMSLPYQGGPKDQSYAIRADGRWLWTPFATPGTDNRFEEVDMTPFAPAVILAAALPNPKGDDRYGEWIELENATMRPQWLNGWTVRTESGVTLDLRGLVIARKKKLRISLEDTALRLRNRGDTLLLYDAHGQLRSALSWKNPDDDQIVYAPELASAATIEQVVLNESRRVRGRMVLSEEMDDEAWVTAPLAGLLPAPSEHLINEYSNLISDLIKNKKIELKNDSWNTDYHLYVDGADIAPILLRAGLAYVPGGAVFAKRFEYEAYEREARRQFRGLWAREESAAAVDRRKLDEALDAQAEKEGLTLTVSPPSGVIESGTMLAVRPSLPSTLFVRQGTGELLPFSGSMLLTSSTYSIVAEYGFRTSSGSSIRSAVVTREYSMLRDRYERCMHLSEIYPSPQRGEREWVEIRNTCPQRLSLLGWSIDDAEGEGSKPYAFGTGVWLGSGETMLLSGARLKVSLNNGGDVVTIRDPAGRVSSSVRYPSIKKGRGYALSGDAWCLTDETTPHEKNACRLQVKTSTRKTSVKTARAIIGLGTKYGPLRHPLLADLNNKSERNFRLFEGMNDNSDSEGISVFIFFYLLVLALVSAFLLWRIRKREKVS